MITQGNIYISLTREGQNDENETACLFFREERKYAYIYYSYICF